MSLVVQPDPPGVAQRPWFRRHPVAIFLFALVFSFVASPYDMQIQDGGMIEAIRLTVVLTFALLAVGSHRTTLRWAFCMVVPALVGKWLNHWWPEDVPDTLFTAPALSFVVFVVLHLLRFIIRAPRIDSEVLCAGVAGYLMLGLLWASVYLLVVRMYPSSFAISVAAQSGQSMTPFTCLYFSLVTLTTLGYGDIVPLSGTTRMLAMMEAMTGTLYMAVLVARLVSMYASATASASTSDLDEP